MIWYDNVFKLSFQEDPGDHITDMQNNTNKYNSTLILSYKSVCFKTNGTGNIFIHL